MSAAPKQIPSFPDVTAHDPRQNSFPSLTNLLQHTSLLNIFRLWQKSTKMQFCKLCFLTCHRPAWRSDWGSAPLVGNRRIFSFFVLLPYFLSNKINSQIPDDTQYLDAAAVSSCDVCTRRKVAGILCILGICSASPPIDGQSTARRHILHFNRELSLSVNGIQPGTFVYSKKNPSPKK